MKRDMIMMNILIHERAFLQFLYDKKNEEELL